MFVNSATHPNGDAGRPGAVAARRLPGARGLARDRQGRRRSPATAASTSGAARSTSAPPTSGPTKRPDGPIRLNAVPSWRTAACSSSLSSRRAATTTYAPAFTSMAYPSSPALTAARANTDFISQRRPEGTSMMPTRTNAARATASAVGAEVGIGADDAELGPPAEVVAAVGDRREGMVAELVDEDRGALLQVPPTRGDRSR